MFSFKGGFLLGFVCSSAFIMYTDIKRYKDKGQHNFEDDREINQVSPSLALWNLIFLFMI